MGKEQNTLSRNSLHAAVCVLLVVITLAGYWRVLHAGFVNLDDNSYVINHLEVHTSPTLSAIAYAFQAVRVSTWQPLVFISFMFDWMLYGLNPMGYHLTNLLLHIASTLLLYFAFQRMTGRQMQSAIIAALFAIHPLHVESVAWISERKDTLSGLFWVLALLAYSYYTQSRTATAAVPLRKKARRNIRQPISRGAILWYIVLLLIFVLGLLSKPMVVTLPIVLLLLDYWPLGRFAVTQNQNSGKRSILLRLIVEKIPLLLLSAAGSVVTFCIQRQEAVQTLSSFPLSARFENVIVSYLNYIGKMLLPLYLGVYYPRVWPHIPLWQVMLSVVVILFVSVAVFSPRCCRPYLKVGWAWYIITMLPVIGIIQVGDQAMADRYTYIPLIGLFMAVTWGISDLTTRLPAIRRPLAGLILLTLTFCTYRQVGYWHDSATLYKHTLSVSRGSYIIHTSLGTALGAQGHADEAIDQFRKAVKLAPDMPSAHYDLAVAYIAKARYNDASEELKETLRLQPADAPQSEPISYILRKGLNRKTLDETPFKLEYEPNPALQHMQAGINEFNQQNRPEAYEQFRKALRCDPSCWQAYQYLANMDYDKGDYTQAWKDVHLCVKAHGVIPQAAIKLLSARMPEPKE